MSILVPNWVTTEALGDSASTLDAVAYIPTPPRRRQ